MVRLVQILLIMLLVAVAGCQKTTGGKAALQVSLSRGLSHAAQIYPTQHWQDTGAILQKGQTYQIKAEGHWSFGVICGVANANGAGNTPLCEGPGSVPGVSSAALVGRIGENGTPFLVGTLKTLQADRSGNLQLGTNAWDWLPGDNSGSMHVTIHHAPGLISGATPALPQKSAAAMIDAAPLAPDTPLPTANTASINGPRVALVIGNSNYPQAPLSNPVNDATIMTKSLRAVGFTVFHHTDLSQKQIKRALNSFSDQLDASGPDTIGLFYYAGHGVQVRGRNYLIPVDANIQHEKDVNVEGVAMDSILLTMEHVNNRLNFIILDACRNNPYKRSFRSSARGLARMDAPRGSLIAYATGPNNVASDGSGNNSPYTEALARAIRQKGVSVERMFRMVRNSVMTVTENQQVPWEASSLTGGDFFFAPR